MTIGWSSEELLSLEFRIFFACWRSLLTDLVVASMSSSDEEEEDVANGRGNGVWVNVFCFF